VIYWGRPLDWHNQTLTPNPDTLYFMAFLNTKDVGPIVIEVPPADAGGSLNANIVNLWQVPLEDGGLLGVDGGEGIKLLMLPPDYEGVTPEGYEALQPGTWGTYALFRSNLESHSDADVEKSVAYGKRVKIYPLSRASNPPATTFIDVQDVDYDSTIRYDMGFFESLNRIVQSEPWLERDRAMIDPLRTIGIEKGQPFAPTADTKKILEAGIREAHMVLAARYDAGLPPFYEGTHWTVPAPPSLVKAYSEGLSDPSTYPVDDRGSVLRPQGSGWQGVELGAHRSRAPVRADAPTLCADESAVRQDVDAERRREDVRTRICEETCHVDDPDGFAEHRDSHWRARIHARLRQRLSDRRDRAEAL
jgi:hypothetical protein